MIPHNAGKYINSMIPHNVTKWHETEEFSYKEFWQHCGAFDIQSQSLKFRSKMGNFIHQNPEKWRRSSIYQGFSKYS